MSYVQIARADHWFKKELKLIKPYVQTARPDHWFKKELKLIKPYVQIARPDHWFKNVFMLPGIIFGLYDMPNLLSWSTIPSAILGFFSTCLVASSNYTLNEILDAPKDKLHPVKKYRPVPAGEVNIAIGYAQWILLGIIGLFLGGLVNRFFFYSLLALLIMGFLYNVPPIRLKDIPYLDVLAEAINNPIRLFLGWFIVNDIYPPTLSLILAYWMLGAFFMAIKRFAEYKKIGNKSVASEYRKSFSHYNEYRLLLSVVYYASAFSFFSGLFIMRYRMELIWSIPFLAGFIPIYLRLAFWEDSPAQYPEKLYKQRGLVVYTSFCLVLVLFLLFVDIPIVEEIFAPAHMPGR